MRVQGKITGTKVAYQKEKTDQQGRIYQSVKVNLYFQAGDDNLIIPIWLSVYAGQTIDSVLQKRNMFVGARGEMKYTVSVKAYNGADYEEKDDIKWVCDNKLQEAQAAPEVAPVIPPSEPQPATPAPQEAQVQGTDLPY